MLQVTFRQFEAAPLDNLQANATSTTAILPAAQAAALRSSLAERWELRGQIMFINDLANPFAGHHLNRKAVAPLATYISVLVGV